MNIQTDAVPSAPRPPQNEPVLGGNSDSGKSAQNSSESMFQQHNDSRECPKVSKKSSGKTKHKKNMRVINYNNHVVNVNNSSHVTITVKTNNVPISNETPLPRDSRNAQDAQSEDFTGLFNVKKRLTNAHLALLSGFLSENALTLIGKDLKILEEDMAHVKKKFSCKGLEETLFAWRNCCCGESEELLFALICRALWDIRENGGRAALDILWEHHSQIQPGQD